MKKVITYGTYDLLHYGHIRLLERAKALGDYLIVGVTADNFDKSRGKINVAQSLMERIEAVKATGLADEIIVEEYEGQKIDDIKRYDIDIFTVGSDWRGKFDYLSEFCEVVYLERTQGVSSSEIRGEKNHVKIGLAGGTNILSKYLAECRFVNGINVEGIYSEDEKCIKDAENSGIKQFEDYASLLETVDAVYILESEEKQYGMVKEALESKVHVLCESPVAMNRTLCSELFEAADRNGVVLMDAIKTAYATAYNRLQLLLKTGVIGKVVAVDVTCTSMRDIDEVNNGTLQGERSSMIAWGPTACLPVLQLLGTDYRNCRINSWYADDECRHDLFSKIDFEYKNAVATVKVGVGVKSEGEMIISGTKGYIYVPAPWWKTDYFEVRYEDASNNKRYFYQLEGEGIRYQIVAFVKAISSGKKTTYIEQEVSEAIASVMEMYRKNETENLKL